MARGQVFDAAGLAEAGLAVVRREGWAAVTMRSVAVELGVSPMALYRVAPDAEQLRRLVADAAAVTVGAVVGRSTLSDVLRGWAVDAHGHLGRHPGLAAYVLLHWTELPGWLDVVETLLVRADESGLSGADAVATVNAVFAFVLARAQLHDGLTAPPRELAPLQQEPERYPLVHRNRAELTTAQTDRHFRFGLDALVAGLETYVRP
jgi:AcrR family transcriptional regulator